MSSLDPTEHRSEEALTGGDDDDVGSLEGVGETVRGEETLDLGGGVDVREVDGNLEFQQSRGEEGQLGSQA